jgi:hypothetical protein
MSKPINSDHFGFFLIISEHFQAIPIMSDQALSVVIHKQASLTKPVNSLFTLS